MRGWVSKEEKRRVEEEEEPAADEEEKIRDFVLCLVKFYDEVIVKVVGLLCG